MLATTAPTRRTLATASLTLFLLAATMTGCAAASDTTPEPPVDESQTDTADAADGADDSGDAGDGDTPAGPGGTVALGTTIYTVNEIYNCEIFPDDSVASSAIERTLDLTVLGTSSQGADMQLFIYLQTASGVSNNSADYAGDEGLYTNDGNLVVREENGNLIGAAAVVDDAGTESLMLQFTVPVPDDTIDCR